MTTINTRAMRGSALRLIAGIAIAAAVSLVQLSLPAVARGATPLPHHELEKAACMGGGNHGPGMDYIQPYVPIIYAFNNRPGVLENQDVAYQFRLNRWTANGWVPDPQTPWSAWEFNRVFDTDSPNRYLGGTYAVPSGIRLAVPQLGHYYAVSFRAAWKDPHSGSWTYGPVKWAGYHLNLVNGSMWSSDLGMGFYGCDFVPDYGYITIR